MLISWELAIAQGTCSSFLFRSMHFLMGLRVDRGSRRGWETVLVPWGNSSYPELIPHWRYSWGRRVFRWFNKNADKYLNLLNTDIACRHDSWSNELPWLHKGEILEQALRELSCSLNQQMCPTSLVLLPLPNWNAFEWWGFSILEDNAIFVLCYYLMEKKIQAVFNIYMWLTSITLTKNVLSRADVVT